MMFRDRRDAGRRLGSSLRASRHDAELVVLGLPRGGVAVAHEIAMELGARLDVWVARRLAYRADRVIGAIAEGGEVLLDPPIARRYGATEAEIERAVHAETQELGRRVRRYRRGRPHAGVRDRAVVLVDDGSTPSIVVRAAARAIRRLSPRRLVFAVPTASAETLEALRGEVDEVVCVDGAARSSSPGDAYAYAEPPTDDEIVELLDLADRAEARRGGASVVSRDVRLRAADASLEGSLAVPDDARGIVVFAHGADGGRLSPRNELVAEALRGAGFATLLLDLLTPDELDEDERGAEHHFDVARMAERLGAATEWLEARAETRHLRVGYFGASTGAAAAIVAASRAPGRVHAIVSRGGRPDLAGEALVDVSVPTRLVVGARDTDVLALNEQAFEDLGGPRDLAVVPGAMHLFQEPGALERVAELAIDWFEKYLVPHRLAATG